MGSATASTDVSATGRHIAGPAPADAAGTYATTSFWSSQAPGERVGAGSGNADPVLLRLWRALRSLGPWVLVHVAFIAAAVGTGWYVYAVVLDGVQVSVPLLMVLVGEVGLAVVLSTLHVTTQLAR